MTAINTTIANNIASGRNTAGGIDDVSTTQQETTVDLHNCTIAYNTTTSTSNGSQLSATGNAEITFQNTIIAGDAKIGPAGHTDRIGKLISDGYNLCTDSSCNLVKKLMDLPNTDPGLAPLGYYSGPTDSDGGPTETMGLLPDSKAIEAGNSDPLVDTDQRGIGRPQFDNPDIGAFESQGFSLDVVSGDGQETLINSAFPNGLVVALSSPDGVPIPQGIQVIFTSLSQHGDPGTASLKYTATLDDSGQASVNVRANGVAGDYVVEAQIQVPDPNVTSPADFSLTNNDTTIAIDDVQVTESDSGEVPATFTVSVSDPSDEDVTVHYQTVNGTAKAGVDYVAASGTLTIPANSLSGTITIMVNGNQRHQNPLTFSVVLSKATNAMIQDGQGTCTITDNHQPPTIAIDNVKVTEGVPERSPRCSR